MNRCKEYRSIKVQKSKISLLTSKVSYLICNICQFVLSSIQIILKYLAFIFEHDLNLKIYLVMNFIRQEGYWIWQRTLESLEFTAWYGNQPDNGGYNGGQNCLVLSHRFEFQWDDNSCVTKRSFICQKQQSMCTLRFDFLTSGRRWNPTQ